MKPVSRHSPLAVDAVSPARGYLEPRAGHLFVGILPAVRAGVTLWRAVWWAATPSPGGGARRSRAPMSGAQGSGKHPESHGRDWCAPGVPQRGIPAAGGSPAPYRTCPLAHCLADGCWAPIPDRAVLSPGLSRNSEYRKHGWISGGARSARKGVIQAAKSSHRALAAARVRHPIEPLPLAACGRDGRPGAAASLRTLPSNWPRLRAGAPFPHGCGPTIGQCPAPRLGPGRSRAEEAMSDA